MKFELCPHCETSGVCQFGVLNQVMTSPDSSRSDICCPAQFQGLPGMAHGGWICAMFDDTMGRHAMHVGDMIHTVSLTVDFVRPVPVGPALYCTVKSEQVAERRWSALGELRIVENDGLLAKAAGTFVQPRRKPPGMS